MSTRVAPGWLGMRVIEGGPELVSRHMNKGRNAARFVTLCQLEVTNSRVCGGCTRPFASSWLCAVVLNDPKSHTHSTRSNTFHSHRPASGVHSASVHRQPCLPLGFESSHCPHLQRANSRRSKRSGRCV